MGIGAILLFLIAGIALVGGGILVSMLVAPKLKTKTKDEAFECGIETFGSSWVQFRVGYYLFAILFLLFDVETVFLFPWAVVMKDIGLTAFIEALIFLVILGLGLLYAWNKDALKWE
jgi:NADH-quinone oxidoreductase subunit A